MTEEPPPAMEEFATLEEVAKELGVSPERVRQIEMQALRKLRSYCRQNALRLGDFIP